MQLRPLAVIKLTSQNASLRSHDRPEAGIFKILGSCKLAVGSCKLLVGSCKLSVGSCKLSVGSCKLSVGSCKLSVGSCKLAVDSCKLCPPRTAKTYWPKCQPPLRRQAEPDSIKRRRQSRPPNAVSLFGYIRLNRAKKSLIANYQTFFYKNLRSILQ